MPPGLEIRFFGCRYDVYLRPAQLLHDALVGRSSRRAGGEPRALALHNANRVRVLELGGTSQNERAGLPQITNSELVADLEAILLELRDRLNNYLDLGAADIIAADEGFNFAGQLQATLADGVEHTASVRERLVEIQRKDS